MKWRARTAAALLAALLLGLTLLGSCAPKDKAEEPPITKITDLAGKRVASYAGTVFAGVLDTVVDGAQHMYFNDLTALLEALETGKADAALMDEPTARLAIAQRPKLFKLEEKLAEDSYGFALDKGNPLTEKMSAVIRQFREDGTLDALGEKWFATDDALRVLPELTYKPDFDGSAGTIRSSHDVATQPMSYLGDDGKVRGYDVELMMRVAYELNMNLELTGMEFSSLLMSLATGKSDAVGGCISITEERKKSVDFTEPYYIGGMVVVLRNNQTTAEPNAPVQLDGKRVGVMTGSTGEIVIARDYPAAAILSFDSFSDAVAALSSKKLDYVIGSYSSMMNYARNTPGLTVLRQKMSDEANAIALKKGNIELRDKIDVVLDKFEEDGTLAELEARWVKADHSAYEEVEIPKRETGDVLRVAISADREPISFVMEGRYVGFDCELIERIAYEMGMRVEYQNMKFAGLLAALHSGKADLVISNLSYTEERAESVEFTRTYFDNPQALLTTETVEVAAVPWYQGFIRGFERTFLEENRWKMVLDGLGATLSISALSVIVGTALGFGVCLMRRSKRRWLRAPATLFVGVIQGLPIVVILMLIFFCVFSGIDAPPILAAVIAFSVNFAAYVSEMMRTGIDAVDKGQLEAASAIGFNPVEVFLKITLPQAARHVLPVYKGELISMVKMTSVVGYIAIQDLTRVSDIIRSRTLDAFFPLISIALIYLGLSYLVAFLLSRVEFKIDPKQRKRGVKGVVEQ